MVRAVFPGSFDPPTLGHVDLVRRASRLFAELRWAVGHHPDKRGLLPVERRLQILRELVESEGLTNVQVDSFTGLLVDYARREDLRWVVRGVRGARDLEDESSMAATNATLFPGLETVLLTPRPQLAHVCSTRVREVASFGGDVSALVPPLVAAALGRGPAR